MSPPKDQGPKNLAAIRRKALNLSPTELVRVRHFEDQRLPLLIEPVLDGLNLIAWAKDHREEIEAHLLREGAILFRGFGKHSAAELEQFILAVSGVAMPYKERSSPRSQVEGHIYTSTEYPAHQSIFLHNENSYAQTWPLHLFFCCVKAAERGGETPIADTRRVFHRIDSTIRDRFREKQVLYVRNFGLGVGLPWSTVFQTTDPKEVEEYCRIAGYRVEWKSAERLTTRRLGPAFVKHPRTAELSWFNHAAFFHISTLDPAVRDALLLQFNEEDLPNNTYYGDGSSIEPSVLDEIREAYRQETMSFPWREGDILMIDNMLTAHGRSPYAGLRTILVGMTKPVSIEDLDRAP